MSVYIDWRFVYQVCNEFPCPQWSAWEPQEECSKSCGNGKQKMKRICINGRSGDDGCKGPQMKYKNCNEGKSLKN